MTYYTLGSWTSCSRCGSSCGWKGSPYLQLSLDTSYNIFLCSSSNQNPALPLSAELTVENLCDCYSTIKHFHFHNRFRHHTWHPIEFVDIFKILNLSIWMSISFIFMIIMKQVWKSCTNIKVNLWRRIYPCSPHMEPQEFLTFASLFFIIYHVWWFQFRG